MLEEKKEGGARVALKTIEHELNDLHIDKRQSEDMINNQQHQIKVLRENVEEERSRLSNNIEYWKSGYESAYLRWKSDSKKTGFSILGMYLACVVAFVLLGYVIYLS